jgi:hypothetical protein
VSLPSDAAPERGVSIGRRYDELNRPTEDRDGLHDPRGRVLLRQCPRRVGRGVPRAVPARRARRQPARLHRSAERANLAQFALVPNDSGKLIAQAGAAGLPLDGPYHALLIQGDDELGALANVHEQLVAGGRGHLRVLRRDRRPPRDLRLFGLRAGGSVREGRKRPRAVTFVPHGVRCRTKMFGLCEVKSSGRRLRLRAQARLFRPIGPLARRQEAVRKRATSSDEFGCSRDRPWGALIRSSCKATGFGMRPSLCPRSTALQLEKAALWLADLVSRAGPVAEGRLPRK